MPIEKQSILGLFHGKSIKAFSTNSREHFILMFGENRVECKIILIDIRRNQQYYKIMNGMIDAESLATKVAFALEDNDVPKVMDYYDFINWS